MLYFGKVMHYPQGDALFGGVAMGEQSKYQGTVYPAPNGMWSWKIEEDGLNIVGGTGYETEFEAEEDMKAELLVQEKVGN